jgi:hypothetical protein
MLNNFHILNIAPQGMKCNVVSFHPFSNSTKFLFQNSSIFKKEERRDGYEREREEMEDTRKSDF